MGFFSPSSWQSKEKRQPTIAKCGQCGLYKKAISAKMQPTGEGERKVLFVAEAPGEKEDREGVQLIGDCGQLHREVLSDMDQDLDDCWKTNAVICRPPGNEIKPVHIESCRPNLLNTVKKLQPKVIVLLGKSAIQSLLRPLIHRDSGPVRTWVGWNIPSHEYNAWICPTYHPSFLLRMDEDQTLVDIYERHIRRAFELEDVERTAPTLEELKEDVEILPTVREGRVRMRDLAKKEGVLAFDYEATGLKPENPKQEIVSVSFCLNGEETWACPVDETSAKSLSKVLKSTKLRKIASNIKFEERWTRAKLGHPVANWAWDTMLAAHYYDNRPKISSVKFQAFVLFGISDYNSHIKDYLESDFASGFNKIRELDLNDLLMYNALDSLLEFMVAQRQREDLGWKALA